MFKYKITEAEYKELVNQMSAIKAHAYDAGQQSVTYKDASFKNEL